jgi:hypothetical protein
MITLKRKHSPHIDKKLVFRLRIYFALAIVLLCVLGFEIFSNRVSFILAFGGLVIGVGIGVITARMFMVSWDKDAKKVISRLDYFGGIILILYFIFSIFRNKLIGDYEYFCGNRCNDWKSFRNWKKNSNFT